MGLFFLTFTTINRNHGRKNSCCFRQAPQARRSCLPVWHCRIPNESYTSRQCSFPRRSRRSSSIAEARWTDNWCYDHSFPQSARGQWVKLVDPMGEMLENSWEAYSTELANAKNEDVAKVYKSLEEKLKINPVTPSRVTYARDTRPSGPKLVQALVDALQAAGAEYTDYKLLTTPQLHYLTRCTNTEGTPQSYGDVSEKGYYEKLAAAFVRAMKGEKTVGPVTVDCANGVGGPKLAELLKYLPKASEGVEIKILNDDVLKAEVLNHECGADYVKTKQRAPPSSKAGPNERCCSLDGDADRIIYYFNDPEHGFRLLDGDKIATLAASFIGDLAREARLSDELKIGVVQTAYANGASTKYVEKSLGLPVVCTPTGVKWLHHAATKFDVGV